MLPIFIKFGHPINSFTSKTDFIVVNGMMRSGNHLIINWISKGLTNTLHINHCFFRKMFKLWHTVLPRTGRYVIYDRQIEDSGIIGLKRFKKEAIAVGTKTIVYSFENFYSNDRRLIKLTKKKKYLNTVIIIRSPENWLASCFKKGFSEDRINFFCRRYAKNLKQLANSEKRPFILDYDTFVLSKAYRKKMFSSLNLNDFDYAETALKQTLDFGNGSSFKDNVSTTYFTRSKEFENNKLYQSLLSLYKLPFYYAQLKNKLN